MSLDFNFLTTIGAGSSQTAAASSTSVTTSLLQGSGNIPAFAQLLNIKQTANTGASVPSPLDSEGLPLSKGSVNTGQNPLGNGLLGVSPQSLLNTELFSGTPGIQGEFIQNEGNSKDVIAPQISDEPGAQIGPIETTYDFDALVLPLLTSTPGEQVIQTLVDINAGTIILPLNANFAEPQTGPVLTEANPKASPAPQISGAPIIQTGPILTEANPKANLAPQISGAPIIQTGPILTEANLKANLAPQVSGAPIIQTGPVLTEANVKNIVLLNISAPYSSSAATPGQIELAPRLRAQSGAAPKGSQQTTGAQPGTANTSSTASVQSSVATTNLAQNGNNKVLAPSVSTQDTALLNNEKHETPLSALITKTAAPNESLLETRPNTQGIEQGQLVKTAQTHELATQKDTSAAQQVTPRLNQASLAGFAAAMAQRVQNGGTRFEIRLDPAALGKVQIRLEVSADNRVEATVSTHRPEVLSELQRGADSLRRALSDAGFELDGGGLTFSLEQGSEGFGTDQDLDPTEIANHTEQLNEIAETATSILAESDRGFGLTRIFADRIDVRI